MNNKYDLHYFDYNILFMFVTLSTHRELCLRDFSIALPWSWMEIILLYSSSLFQHIHIREVWLNLYNILKFYYNHNFIELMLLCFILLYIMFDIDMFWVIIIDYTNMNLWMLKLNRIFDVNILWSALLARERVFRELANAIMMMGTVWYGVACIC